MTDYNTNLLNLNFFLVICKSKKKLDKYMKINRIRNKYIIDIKTMLDEEEMNYEESKNSDLFKIQILKKINLAKEKNKDIYFIPYLEKKDSINYNIFNIKTIIETTHNFNLLFFYDDYNQETDLLLNNIHEFEISQILKDY